MQIILVQTEVVQALRDYVASRLTLAEGTEITVDLSATRGANGVTATIDLVEPSQKATPAPVQQVIKVPAAKPETANKAPEAQQATQVAQSAAETQERATGLAAEASEGTTSGDTATQQADPATETKVEGETAAPTKSLFGNLARPKN